MIERRLRAHLEAAGGATLAVVEVEASESCALAVSVLANSLAREGRRVVVADMANGRPVASLLDVTRDDKKLHAVTLEEHSFVVMVAPDDPVEMGPEWTPKGADVLLVVTSADVAFGSEHLAAWAGKAVVMVNMKRATAPTCERHRRAAAPGEDRDPVRHPHRGRPQGRRARGRSRRRAPHATRAARQRRLASRRAVISPTIASGGRRLRRRTNPCAGCG